MMPQSIKIADFLDRSVAKREKERQPVRLAKEHAAKEGMEAMHINVASWLFSF